MMGEVTVEVDEEVTKQDFSLEPLPEPLLIILSPPPPFLPVPGTPTMFWRNWLKSFENYVEALNEHELSDSSRCSLLQNCLGPEGQRIFTTLIQSETTYATAVSVLTVYFSADPASQMYRLKFHQRAQAPGESVDQFVSALGELLQPCNYEDSQEKLILDQLIEKTHWPQLKERLVMERETLTLDRAMVIGKEVESALSKSELFGVHEVSVDIEDDFELPVQKRKRGRPRKGESRANTKTQTYTTKVTESRVKIKTEPHPIKISARQCRFKDNYYYMNDKLYYSDNEEDYRNDADEMNLSCDKPINKKDKEDDFKPHVQKRKRGRPRKGESRADNKTQTYLTKEAEGPSGSNDNLYSMNDKPCHSNNVGAGSNNTDEVTKVLEDYGSSLVSSQMIEERVFDKEIDDIDEDDDEDDDDDDDDYVASSSRRKGPLCPICVNRRFRDAHKLARHMRTHTKEKPFTCPICPTTFSQSYHMTRHMRNQHSAGPFICSICGQSVESYIELRNHKSAHAPRIQTCPVCQEAFTKEGAFFIHMMSHSKDQSDQTEEQSSQESDEANYGEIIQSCVRDDYENCNDNVAEMDASCGNDEPEDKEPPITFKIEHVDPEEVEPESGGTQTGKGRKPRSKPHVCPICPNRRFKGSNKLSRHMRTHTKEKPFSCPVCSLTFSQSYHMTRHLRNKHELGQYICPKCGKSLESWMELKEHKKTHAIEGLTCLACDKQFKERTALVNHLKIHKKVANPRSLSCGDCGKVFGRMYHLKRHIMSHRKATNSECYTCPDCQKNFAFPEDLNKHLEIHVKENNGTCPKCDEKFSTPEELEAHMGIHDKTYSCNTCGKKFKVEYALKKHEQGHQHERYYCSLCQKRFIKLSHYKRHILVHNRRESRCPYCDSIFLQITAFKYHLRTHVEERPFQCSCCIETFEDKDDLDQHCLKHRKFKKERPYSCTRCDNAYTTLIELTDHMTSHEGEQPQNCPICGKTFLNKNKLEKHLSIHTGERPHLCSICGNGFPSAASLKLHLHIHSGEKPFHCSQCSKTFRSSSGLRLHSRQHLEVRPSYECPECGRTYGRMTELKMHQRYHTGDKPYACTCCSKRFISKDKLNVHMRIHTGERPYSCPHCGQTFTQTGDRNRHISKFH
ncbi:zinc finger protein 585A-like [Cheilinus undulatus]|uniref:zinc finger protein 585A-like n=1 Tax=Cheilinus undulatus TaxID=241271 RepID=UPI001BD4C2B1|nr:zinc finger protein 585A-like [Cheilinus undulatus]